MDQTQGRFSVWIRRMLLAGVLLLWGTVIAGCLWGIFNAVGDASAARVSLGVTLALAISLGVSLIAVVGILGCAYVRDSQAANADG